MSTVTAPIERSSLYIGGSWERPADRGTVDILNPATGTTLGRVGTATASDVNRAVDAARASFERGDWRLASVEDRAAVMRRTVEILRADKEQIVDLLTSELGCPRWFAERAHFPTALKLFGGFADLAEGHTWDEERSDGRLRSLVVRHPVGVVGAVTPWNGPITNPTFKIAPAIAAGCSIVLKAAPVTPLTGFVLMEALAEAGLPPGVVNYIPGDRDAGRHLVSHPGIDKVAFTGSTAAGREIMAACAAHITRVTLELGGKSAAIMLDDCPIETFVAGVLPLSLMLVNGQACIAQTRLLVPRARYDEAAEALTEAVRAVRVGDPFESDTQVGPLVSEAQRERVEGYIAVGLAEGARITTGGGRPDAGGGWWVDPTVFVNVENGMRIAQEEIFGPVVALIPYDGEDDAVRIANDTIYGLAGSVWTEDDDRGRAVARRVRAGVVSINGYPQAFGTPFGGFKQSGLGRELGPEGLNAYTELQSISLGPVGGAGVDPSTLPPI